MFVHRGTLFALLIVLLAGCGDTSSVGALRAAEDQGPYRGVMLEEPIPRPDFTLPDTEGEPFDFLAEAEGYLTFLFFGYTYCPDVCPVHQANLAAVLDGLHWEDRARVKVIFVTVDPERDTADRMREWLDAFDRSFIGLRGTLEEVNAIMLELGLPPAVFEDTTNADYTIGHASQILAFPPSGPAQVVYPFGTRQSELAHDLPILLRTEASVRIGGAVIAEPTLGERTAMYASIENRTAKTDVLLEANSAVAGRVELHQSVERGGRMHMDHVDEIAVPGRGRARLVPGGYHIMLLDLEERLAAGDTVEVELVFRDAGPITVQAEVRPYADLERWMSTAEDSTSSGRR